MRAKSHLRLGQKLADQYMSKLPHPCRRAFLLGCTQPDKNPTTYFKGSVRSQWLRGHNWSNAKRYICRLIWRLENKQQFKVMDYYALGKLIHYTADAFTYVHNDTFSARIKDHRNYEAALEAIFLPHLEKKEIQKSSCTSSCQCILFSCHKKYMKLPCSVSTDTRFICHVCSTIMYRLLTKTSNHA